MNLFENLQLMKESYTSIVSEFKEFLNNKNAQYIASEIDETKDGMQIVIYNGDWKHEHLYMKHLLDDYIQQNGLINKVVLVGSVPNPYPYIAKSRLLLLPSFSEALPTVILEAFSLGITVVATPTNGANDLLKNGTLGYISSSFDNSSGL